MVTKIYLCPSDKKYGCSWEGSSDDILEHFMQEHEDLLFYTNSVSITLEALSENYLIFVDTEIYLLQTKIVADQLCIYLRYLGPAKIASKITFDIDITCQEKKLEKHDISFENGYFTVSLKCLKASFGDVHTLNCHLLISGDFKSNSSDGGVFMENETSLREEEILQRHIANRSPSQTDNNSLNSEDGKYPHLPHLDLKPTLERNYSLESNGEMTPCLEDLFFLARDGMSPDERKKPRAKSVTEEVNRSKWYENADMLFENIDSSKSEHTSLQRSNTFGSEEIKKRNIAKRNSSIRSLDAIRECDAEVEFRCSNCDSHLAPPIFLCESYHNICLNCYRDHENCTTCDLRITADRNVDLEEKSIEYMYTCKNKKNGCPKKLSYKEICEHEINCTYCNYYCPMDQCGYKGPYRNMHSHLNLIHSSVKLFDTFIAVFQKHTELFLANERMGFFYCTLKVLDDVVVWKAKFCGPKERKFFCELKFKGKDFKYPLLLVKYDDYYLKEIPTSDLKEQKIKSKYSILTITR